MKRILVPIDFSKLSENVLLFANKLAARMGADIVLLHCSQLEDASETTIINLKANLQSLAERLRYQNPVRQQARRIRFTYEVRKGCLQHHVLDLSAKSPFNLIVMALEYADCEPAVFPGSHAAQLAEVVECPVLLVPNHGQFHSLNKLVFATDFTDQDPNVLQQIAAFAEVFQAHLSVIQVYTKAERNQLLEFKKGIKQLQQTINYPNLSCHLKEEDDMLESFSEFAEKQQADLLILATQDSFLLQNLFDIRYTKTGAYHTLVPILAFHQHKQKPCAGCCVHCATKHEIKTGPDAIEALSNFTL